MKYCVKCGNPMEDEMLFCQKCGAQCVAPGNEANHSPQHDFYAEYWGLHYKDTESGNEIELTPDGVHIFHAKGIKKGRFDKTIPYAEIIDINSERATALKSGYFSIITTTEGITGEASRMQILGDHNTVLFTKKTEPEAERIYRALDDICNAPPTSSCSTTFYENSHNTSSFSASLANPPKAKKRKGCLIPIIVFSILFAVIIGVSNSDNSDKTNSSSQQSTQTSEKQAIEIELTREEERFVQAFGCTAEQAKQMYAIFEEIGLTLSSADKVSRREDLDNWDNDGSIAYEIADVIRVDGEKQRAFLYVTNDFQVLDVRFLSCYLYENGAFVQTAEEAVNVGWAASLFETECPITVSASMTTDLIGTPVIKATISNNSSKNISAVKILAHPLDVYGNAIQNYGYGKEYTSLNSDEQIYAGGAKTVSWSLYGYDATKTAELWVYSVYFEDGTQWGSYDGLSIEIMQTYGLSLTAE